MTALITLVGAVLRIANLLVSKSYWGDEIYSLIYAQDPGHFMWGTNHPPLYYYILGWTHPTTEMVARAISVSFGIGLIPMVIQIAEEWTDRRTALWAGLFVAVSPYFLQMSNEVRAYSLLAYFSLAAWGIPAFAVILPYIEHIGIFATIFVTSKEKASRKFALAVATLPWLAIMIYQATHNEHVFNYDRIREYMVPALLLKKGFGVFWHIFFGYRYSMITVSSVVRMLRDPIFVCEALLTAACAVMSVKLILSSKRTRRYGFSFVVPFLILLAFYPIRLDARYMAFAAPAMFIGLSMSLVDVYWVKRLLVVIMLAESIWTISLKTDPIHREDLRGAEAYIFNQAVIDQAATLKIYQEISPENITFLKKNQSIKTVYVQKTVNMHPDETERILSADFLMMATAKFYLDSYHRFGPLTGVYKYVRVEKPEEIDKQ